MSNYISKLSQLALVLLTFFGICIVIIYIANPAPVNRDLGNGKAISAVHEKLNK